MVSDIMLEANPSMQVNSYQALNGALTSDYHTAATHTSRHDDLALGPTRCQELFIKDLNKFIITVLQVEPEDTVEAVKKLLCYSIKVPNIQLYYSDQTLTNPTKSLKQYGVLHNSSLYTTSTIQNLVFPTPWFMSLRVNYVLLQGISNKPWEVSFKLGDRIGGIKKLYWKARLGKNPKLWPYTVELVWERRISQDEEDMVVAASAIDLIDFPPLFHVVREYKPAHRAFERQFVEYFRG